MRPSRFRSPRFCRTNWRSILMSRARFLVLALANAGLSSSLKFCGATRPADGEAWRHRGAGSDRGHRHVPKILRWAMKRRLHASDRSGSLARQRLMRAARPSPGSMASRPFSPGAAGSVSRTSRERLRLRRGVMPRFTGRRYTPQVPVKHFVTLRSAIPLHQSANLRRSMSPNAFRRALQVAFLTPAPLRGHFRPRRADPVPLPARVIRQKRRSDTVVSPTWLFTSIASCVTEPAAGKGGGARSWTGRAHQPPTRKRQAPCSAENGEVVDSSFGLRS